MGEDASDLAGRLAREAERVCRHYLSNGRREGAYWLVGDIRNQPGRSLYVRLATRTGAAAGVGKWTDAATGEHGDLLDLIAMNQGLSRLRDTLDEARRFLALPREDKAPLREGPLHAAPGSVLAARRLFSISRPLPGTPAETYLRNRGLIDLRGCAALRFHPDCYYRPIPADRGDAPSAAPALICAVTELGGRQTGVQRTWLNPWTFDKAQVASPRRAMGELLGHGVRIGSVDDVVAAGEGVETLLSLRQAAPRLPLIAALSAAHLAALRLSPGLRRLYLARDNDPAGDQAVMRLSERAGGAGVEVIVLDPVFGDFNDDLRRLGAPALGARLAERFAPDDARRFLGV
jgi:hypothetical protein